MEKEIKKIIIRCKSEQDFIDSQRYLYQFGFVWWYSKNHPLSKYQIVDWHRGVEEMHIVAELETKWLSVNCYRHDKFDGESISLAQLKNTNLLTNKIKTMTSTITTLIKKINRGEPEKTFVSVGFIDENENITEDGKEALIHILWAEKQKELKELADKLKELADKLNENTK